MDMRDTIARLMENPPDIGASMLLTHFDGDRRAAEVEAWKLWGVCAGGDVGRRPREKSPEATYFQFLIRAIIDNCENPPVARVSKSIKPAGAVAAPWLTKTVQ